MNYELQNFHVPLRSGCPTGQPASGEALWRAAPPGSEAAAKRAFYTGIVKNQQRSESELLYIGMGGRIGTLNFHAPLVSHRDCEKSAVSKTRFA